LGNILALSRPEEAIEHYHRALVIEPELAEAHFHLANTLAFGGRTREAIGHLQQALKRKPDWPEARRNLAILLEFHAEASGPAGRRPPEGSTRAAE
jgi:tetratricopeptide (TPR) repeat protein